MIDNERENKHKDRKQNIILMTHQLQQLDLARMYSNCASWGA